MGNKLAVNKWKSWAGYVFLFSLSPLFIGVVLATVNLTIAARLNYSLEVLISRLTPNFILISVSIIMMLVALFFRNVSQKIKIPSKCGLLER